MTSSVKDELPSSKEDIVAARNYLIEALASSPSVSAVAGAIWLGNSNDDIRFAPADPAAVEASMNAEFPPEVLRATSVRATTRLLNLKV